MHLEFLVEELSAEDALKQLLPSLLPVSTTFELRPYQGKGDLLKALPDRLRGYRAMMSPTYDLRIVVLVDRDKEDCVVLKSKLDTIASSAGLTPKVAAAGGNFHVLNRIAIEELEAWFLGDCEAIALAYPGFNPRLWHKPKFRDPDAIANTWETLERELSRVGHHLGGYRKVQGAREIAGYMDPVRNRSRSFQVFRDGLAELTR